MASQDGFPALLLAIEEGHDAMMDMLLDRGADMEARARVSQGRHCGHANGASSTVWCLPAALSLCGLGARVGTGEGGGDRGGAVRRLQERHG